MLALEYLKPELAALEARNLLRVPSDGEVGPFLDFTSNDYLGLARSSVSRETLLELAELPAGSGASRLIHGTHPAHRHLETLLADWLGAEDALLFSSGYAANLGVLSALPQAGDLIISDALNHASIIDGCRLSRAAVHITPHRDVEAVRAALDLPARRRWVVTESYFSMDGDTPDLPALRALTRDRDAALIVDEAHALGVFGPDGAGICARDGVVPDVIIGTLGKAVGLHGAFVAGARPLRTYLWNRARSFVYSTATLPLLAALACHRIPAVRAAHSARTRLLTVSDALRAALAAADLPLSPGSHGPILPVVLGDPVQALAATKHLAAAGLRVQPIRPPTVPAGTSRLRLTVNTTHTDAHLELLATALITACRQ